MLLCYYGPVLVLVKFKMAAAAILDIHKQVYFPSQKWGSKTICKFVLFFNDFEI